MDRVVRYLEHLGEHPTADMIARARFLPKREKKRVLRTSAEGAQALQDIAIQAAGAMDCKPMPKYIQDMANWADEQLRPKRPT